MYLALRGRVTDRGTVLSLREEVNSEVLGSVGEGICLVIAPSEGLYPSVTRSL